MLSASDRELDELALLDLGMGSGPGRAPEPSESNVEPEIDLGWGYTDLGIDLSQPEILELNSKNLTVVPPEEFAASSNWYFVFFSSFFFAQKNFFFLFLLSVDLLSIPCLRSRTKILLHCNQLRVLPDILTTCTNATELNLSHNHFTGLSIFHYSFYDFVQ